jgi:hypothetical protein
LLNRGLITADEAWVYPTEEGRRLVGREPEPQVRERRPRDPARAARAKHILKAVDRLRIAIPRDAEVAVGPIFAGADDVLDGLTRYARRIAKGREHD